MPAPKQTRRGTIIDVYRDSAGDVATLKNNASESPRPDDKDGARVLGAELVGMLAQVTVGATLFSA